MSESPDRSHWAESGFVEKDWWKLPLELRRAWWRETKYGELPPSPKLVEIMRRALKEKQNEQG